MATTTTNYGLKKPDSTDFYNVEDQNGNMDAIDAALKENVDDISNLQTIQTADGTATAITLSNIELVDGFQCSFVIAENNAGSSITINDKPLYIPNSTDAPVLTAGESVTVWYDLVDDCFYVKRWTEANSLKLTDDTTATEYEFGISDGALYYREVTE